MSENFACRLTSTSIRDGERIDLVATEAEARAIAKRLGLVWIERLEAHCALIGWQGQAGDPRHAAGSRRRWPKAASPAASRCRPMSTKRSNCISSPSPAAVPDDEIELSGDELDVIFHDGSAIELGEAIADTLALSLDPYPARAQCRGGAEGGRRDQRGAGRPVRGAGGAEGERGRVSG